MKTQTMTPAQVERLQTLCESYDVAYDARHYSTQFDLPAGYVAGWVGGPEQRGKTLYVGVDLDGHSCS